MNKRRMDGWRQRREGGRTREGGRLQMRFAKVSTKQGRRGGEAGSGKQAITAVTISVVIMMSQSAVRPRPTGPAAIALVRFAWAALLGGSPREMQCTYRIRLIKSVPGMTDRRFAAKRAARGASAWIKWGQEWSCTSGRSARPFLLSMHFRHRSRVTPSLSRWILRTRRSHERFGKNEGE